MNTLIRLFFGVMVWIRPVASSPRLSIGSSCQELFGKSCLPAFALVVAGLCFFGSVSADLIDDQLNTRVVLDANEDNSGLIATIADTRTLARQADRAVIPEDLSASDWQKIRTQISNHQRETLYSAEEADDGFVAINEAQGFEVRYHPDGATELVLSGSARHSVALRPLSIGYGRRLSHLHHDLQMPPRDRIADGETVTSIWDDNLREWWVNSPEGLEQWFELASRPAERSSVDDPLVVSMALETSLEPSIRGSGEDQYLQLSGPSTKLRFEKLRVFDADGNLMPAELQLAGNALAYVIDDSQARYPLTIDPTFVQAAYVKPSNANAGDEFGNALDIDGDTVVVGAWLEDGCGTGVGGAESDNNCEAAGAAYVFVKTGSSWVQQAYLKSDDTTAGSVTNVGDFFGESVAISGDTIVVGSRRALNNGIRTGAAYVFVRQTGVWSFQATLVASNAEEGDQFGTSVSISGDTILVGAVSEASSATGVNGDQTNNSVFDAGAAYVFSEIPEAGISKLI